MSLRATSQFSFWLFPGPAQTPTAASALRPASVEGPAACFGPVHWPQRKNWSQRQILGHKGGLVCPAFSGPLKPQEASGEAILSRTDVSSDSWLRPDPSWPAPGTSVFLNTRHMQESAGWSLESSYPQLQRNPWQSPRE